MNEGLLDHLTHLYGPEWASDTLDKLLKIIDSYQGRIPSPKTPSVTLDKRTLTEKDAVLVAYGDMVLEHGTPPLQVLEVLLSRYLQDFLSTVHLLSFYPTPQMMVSRLLIIKR